MTVLTAKPNKANHAKTNVGAEPKLVGVNILTQKGRASVAVRVIRMMEYVYPDLETAEIDMRRWLVQGTWYPGGNGTSGSSKLGLL